jgi:nucleotide-binding universal stress UspA family protein
MYKKVLVPLDGSPVDEAILEHIIRLATLHGSQVTLLRVLEKWTAKYYGPEALPREVEEAQQYLRQVAERLKGKGIEVETVLTHGDPTQVIVREAEERGTDLIAMSTHGHSSLLDLLYGSVSHGVRHTVSIPVLLIKGRRD